MFLLALQFGAAEYGWGSSEVIGLFVGSAVTLLVFLAWEWKMGDDAMFPLAMVRKRVIWSSSLNMAFLMSTNIVAGAFYPIYFQSVRGLSPVMSGVYFLPGIFSQIIAIVLSGALSEYPVPSLIHLRIYRDPDMVILTCLHYSGSIRLLYPLVHCLWRRRRHRRWPDLDVGCPL